jgi:hypothetical protein
MEIFVPQVNEFLIDLDDALFEMYGIITEPLQFKNLETPMHLSPKSGRCVPSSCLISTIHFHNEGTYFCSQPEILAISYLQSTIHHSQTAFLMRDLNRWLPVSTTVQVNYSDEKEIHSHLHPQWLISNLPDSPKIYHYYSTASNKVLETLNYCNCIIKYY